MNRDTSGGAVQAASIKNPARWTVRCSALLAFLYIFWFMNTKNLIFPIIFLSLTLCGLGWRWVWGVWRGAKTSCYLFQALSPNAPSCLLLDLCKTQNPVRRVIEAIAVRHSGLAGRRHLIKTHQNASDNSVAVNQCSIALAKTIKQIRSEYAYKGTESSVDHDGNVSLANVF